MRELNARLAQAAGDDSPEALLEAARLTHAVHRIVFEASGNPWLLQLLDQTSYLPMIHRTHFLFNTHAWQGAIARYENLIEALDARNAEWASSLMRAHFLTAEHQVRKHFRDGQGKDNGT